MKNLKKYCFYLLILVTVKSSVAQTYTDDLMNFFSIIDCKFDLNSFESQLDEFAYISNTYMLNETFDANYNRNIRRYKFSIPTMEPYSTGSSWGSVVCVIEQGESIVVQLTISGIRSSNNYISILTKSNWRYMKDGEIYLPNTIHHGVSRISYNEKNIYFFNDKVKERMIKIREEEALELEKEFEVKVKSIIDLNYKDCLGRTEYMATLKDLEVDLLKLQLILPTHYKNLYSKLNSVEEAFEDSLFVYAENLFDNKKYEEAKVSYEFLHDNDYSDAKILKNKLNTIREINLPLDSLCKIIPFEGAWLIRELADGNYVNISNTNPYKKLTKFNLSGKILFSNNLKINPDDIVITDDNGFVILGTYIEYGSNYSYGKYIIKLDKYGTQVWEKELKVLEYQNNHMVNCGNGYLISGNKNNSLYLLKLNFEGGKVWERTYELLGNANTILKSSDNYFIIGTSKSVIKIDAEGKIIWKRFFKKVNKVEQLADGGYLLLTDNRNLIKLTIDGENVWKKKQEEVKDINVFLISDIKEFGEEFLVVGKKSQQIFVEKLDRKGDVIWGKSLNLPAGNQSIGDDCFNITLIPDGFFLTASDGEKRILITYQLR